MTKKKRTKTDWRKSKDADAVTVETYQRGQFADWRYLVILDACRYDVLAEIAQERDWPAPLKLNLRWHWTALWYREYWHGQNNDAHLISASPFPFHKIGWHVHEKFKTAIWADPAGKDVKTRPELAAIWTDIKSGGGSMFDPALALRIFGIVKQPGERYLIHLMPPHLPYLGERGRALMDRLGIDLNRGDRSYPAIQSYGQAGHWDELRACHKENVEYALDALSKYEHLFADGKVVITADHSELIGDLSSDGEAVYGHGGRYDLQPDPFVKLRTVPWLEIR